MELNEKLIQLYEADEHDLMYQLAKGLGVDILDVIFNYISPNNEYRNLELSIVNVKFSIYLNDTVRMGKFIVFNYIGYDEKHRGFQTIDELKQFIYQTIEQNEQ